MDKKLFFDELRVSGLYRSGFKQENVDGIEGILSAFAEVGDGKSSTLAYALATAYLETGSWMSPIKETVFEQHKDKNPSDTEVIRRLDKWARDIGRTSNIYWRPQPPHGKAYFGRGQVQLTWKENYQKSSSDVGIDLVANPDAMLQSEVSAKILIKGLLDGRWNGQGKGIDYYLSKGDLKNARRTVNITDRWEDVARYYRIFSNILEKSGLPEKVENVSALPTTPSSFDLKKIITSIMNAIRSMKWPS